MGGERRRQLYETSGTDRWRLCRRKELFMFFPLLRVIPLLQLIMVGTCPFAPPRLSSRMSESIVEPQLQPPLSPPGQMQWQGVLFRTGLFSKRRDTRKKTNLWSSASRHRWGGRVKAGKANSSSLWCWALREIYLRLEGARPRQQRDLSGHHRASSNLSKMKRMDYLFLLIQ